MTTEEEKAAAAKAEAEKKATADKAAADALALKVETDKKAAAEQQNKPNSQADRALVDEVAAIKQHLAEKGIMPLDAAKKPAPKKWDWGKVLDPFGLFDGPKAAEGSSGGGK